MKKIIALILIGLLATACGGGAASEPTAAPATDPPPATATTAPVVDEEPEEEAPVAEEEMEEEEPEGAAEEEGEEDMGGEEAADEGGESVGGLPASGVDPDTGLEINPEAWAPGDTFIVRGELVTMNLTPQTEPEFVIQAPNGRRYRIATQALADIFFNDGSQIQAFQYRQGMLATTTAMLAATAGPTDILTSEDFMLLVDE